MMKFFVAFYILVWFLHPPFPSTCPEKFPWRHISSFVSVQNLQDLTLWQAWRLAGVFHHAQLNLRGSPPSCAETESKQKLCCWGCREHCLDLETNQTVGTVWAKPLIKAWLSRYQSGPSWPHVPTQRGKAFSQHCACSPSPSRLQPGCLRGTWRLSSCSGQLGSPLVTAQAVHPLGWFVLVNEVLQTTRGGLYKFYWVFFWMSPENTSGRHFLFSSALSTSLSDISSTRLFPALKQGKSV